MVSWTHKVVYKETKQWWFARYNDGTLYHNDLHEEFEKPRDIIRSFRIKEGSVEDFYNRRSALYNIIKLRKFKGNKQ